MYENKSIKKLMWGEGVELKTFETNALTTRPLKLVLIFSRHQIANEQGTLINCLHWLFISARQRIS